MKRVEEEKEELMWNLDFILPAQQEYGVSTGK